MKRLFLLACALVACGDDAPRDRADTSATTIATDTSSPTDTSVDVAPEVVDRQVYPSIWRLEGDAPDLATDDLEPLWALLEDAEIIGLGESVHTSGGFYAMKDRLIRWLVAEKGLRVFGMETPHSAARALDEYLQTGPCEGDLESVFADGAIFGVFVDDNTVELFRWLCGWNATHANDHVHFFGFDAQQPVDDIAELRAFVAAHAPEEAQAVESFVAHCNTDYAVVHEQADFDACMAGIDALESALAEVDTIDTRARAELAIMIRSLRSWEGQAFYQPTDARRSWESRDIAMADIFDARMALDFEGQRSIVWAHNYHLAADHEAIRKTNFIPYQTVMGTALRERHGDGYAPIAITAHGPGISWPGVADEPTITEQGTAPGSLEAELYDLFPDALLLYSPASDALDPAAEWKVSEEGMIIGDNYDGIIYLRESPPMDALLW